MQQLSKLQIRAKVLSVISEVKMLHYKNEEALKRFVNELNEIEDKKALFDIFLKEYVKLDEQDYIFCACIIKDAVPAEYTAQKAVEYLKSAALSDENKYKIVQLLRITGGDYDYSALPSYFENPDDVLDLETKRLLSSAVFNPESMLDFLDFVSAVPEKDKILLLKSLAEDYRGDELANIVYPIVYSDFSSSIISEAVSILGSSKSSLAIAPLEYLIETSEDSKVINAAKSGLKKLKLAGASKEKADEYFKNIIKDSEIAHCSVTIPDGSGSQALLTAKKHLSGTYSLAAVVISDLTGIIDCFGFFNISQNEVMRIIEKFYHSEGRYTVPKEYIKYRLKRAEKLNIQNKIHYPYEYICWAPMFYDIEPLGSGLQEFAAENCTLNELSAAEAVNLASKEYTLRWFITPSENKALKEVMEKIYAAENMNILEINQLLKNNFDDIFTAEEENIWIDKFYNLIYILKNNKKNKEADDFYALLKDEKLFVLFKQILLQRSVFSGFNALRENIKDLKNAADIFRKKNAEESRYDINKLDAVIEKLKRGWLEG